MLQTGQRSAPSSASSNLEHVKVAGEDISDIDLDSVDSILIGLIPQGQSQGQGQGGVRVRVRVRTRFRAPVEHRCVLTATSPPPLFT